MKRYPAACPVFRFRGVDYEGRPGTGFTADDSFARPSITLLDAGIDGAYVGDTLYGRRVTARLSDLSPRTAAARELLAWVIQ